MKSRILYCSALALCLSTVFIACQKDATTAYDYMDETTTHSDDQSRFSGEMDGAANDINTAIELTNGFTGRIENISFCDGTGVIDTLSNPRTITITYNGAACLPNRTRTGVVVISMAQNVRWRNAGAVLNLSFQNFKITRTSDNKSITINGTQTFTNTSGGLLVNLATLGSITHTITSSNMSVTFDNSSQRNWQVARKRVFSYNNGIVITSTGTHTEGNITGIAEWGTNRFGNAFTTAITQPLIIRQDCNFRLTTGKVVHKTPLFTASATFGLDATGAPASCPGTGAYYLKIEWTGTSGTPRMVILPY
jgi:hypothetical protein